MHTMHLSSLFKGDRFKVLGSIEVVFNYIDYEYTELPSKDKTYLKKQFNFS